MSRIARIKFGMYEYRDLYEDKIDSYRYIIPFTITYINLSPLADEKNNYKITVSITGSDRANKKLFNYKNSDIPKIIYAHSFEYIKSLISKNELSEFIELKLTESRLKKYKLDPNKIPSINRFEFEIDIDNKKFGF